MLPIKRPNFAGTGFTFLENVYRPPAWSRSGKSQSTNLDIFLGENCSEKLYFHAVHNPAILTPRVIRTYIWIKLANL